jgi:Tfp pilus assembly PilM family ATPase
MLRLNLKSLKKVLRILRPRVLTGGLDISDTALFYTAVEPETGAVAQFSVALPAGVVIGGKVAEPAQLTGALKDLHHQITAADSQRLAVVVSISDANVYSQTFSLPPLKSANLEEAVDLNLRTISPVELAQTYHGYHRVGITRTGEIELLGSFVERGIVDPLYDALSEAAFIAVAVEQRALSLIRIIANHSADFDWQAAYCLLHITSDGLSFSIVRGGSLYFNRFASWSLIPGAAGDGREISMSDFRNIVVQESHRVINYYASRFGDHLTAIYVIAPGLSEAVQTIMRENFSYSVRSPALKDFVMDDTWLPSLGAALRGLESKARDIQISLAPEGAREQFFHSQTLVFIRLWRAIIASAFFVILVAFLGAFLFLSSLVTRLNDEMANLSTNFNTTYLEALRGEAAKFNTYVDRALTARGQQTRWENIIQSIFEAAGQDATVKRLSISDPTAPVLLDAEAPSESNAVAFKNKLEKLSFVGAVDLPLANLLPVSSSTIAFRITFTLK